MSVATNPRVAALGPAAVYIKSASCLSNEDAATFLASYITSSKDFLNDAAHSSHASLSAATSSSSTAKNGFVDALAADMAQNEKIVAQLQRVEHTLHNYSETPLVFEQVPEDLPEETPEDTDKPVSKEERKKLKKERKKAERKSKLAQNEQDAKAE